MSVVRWVLSLKLLSVNILNYLSVNYNSEFIWGQGWLLLVPMLEGLVVVVDVGWQRNLDYKKRLKEALLRSCHGDWARNCLVQRLLCENSSDLSILKADVHLGHKKKKKKRKEKKQTFTCTEKELSKLCDILQLQEQLWWDPFISF